MSLSDFRTAKLSYLFRLLDQNQDGLLDASDFDLIAQKAMRNQDKTQSGQLHKRMILASAHRYHHRLADALELEGEEISHHQWITYFTELDPADDLETETLIQFFLEFFFGVFDVNKDGFITLYEAMELFQLLNISLQEAKETFRNLDLNTDGHISRYELRDAVEVFLFGEDPDEKGNRIFGDWRN